MKKMIDEKLNFSELKDSFISNLFDFNINVIYCYNLVLNLKLLKNNIGFFCMIFLLLLQIIFFIIYLVKRLKPLKHFMLIFGNNYSKIRKAFPPIKRKKILFKNYVNENNLNNKIELKKDKDNIIFENNQNKDIINLNQLLKKKVINKNKNNIVPTEKNLIITNNFSPTINLKTSVININNNNIFSNLRKGAKIKKSNPKQLYRKKPNKRIPKTKNKSISDNILSKTGKNKLLINMETKGNINKYNKKKIENNIDIIKLSRNDEDLLDMDYEHAIIYDKRKYLTLIYI